MEPGVMTKSLNIGGMTCVNCQNKIETKLRGTNGVKRAKVSHATGVAVVTYDSGIISIEDIEGVIRGLGYEVLTETERKKESGATRAVGAVLIIIALYILMQRLGIAQMFGNFQLAESGMGYGMIFIIGLITSVHCVAMCGGINLSQCIPAAAAPEAGKLNAFRPAFLYNLGRVVSYTAVGGIVGALGSVLSLSGAFRGAVQIIAGVFMVIMGINMLGIFPWISRFVPRMPRFIGGKIGEEKGRSKSPLYIGLLNGLMPCGPLQAMQLYALSTGSMVSGALSMMLFSLGTVPLMFGLGAVSSILSKKFTNKMMTAGAVLVAVLGLSMLSQGLSLSGFSGGPISKVSANSSSGTGIVVENGVQIVNSTLSPRGYPAITVQAGIPVKWTIDAPGGSINGCNYVMFIPEYNIQYEFKQGENVIEFTPEKSGTFQYSCWMGMIRSRITVLEEGALPAEAADEEVPPDDGAWDTGGGCCSVWL